MDTGDAYWNDVMQDMKDPEYLRDYITELVRVRAVDSMVNALSEALKNEMLTKADVARAVQVRPEVVRRLLTAETANPTIGTISEIAAALGFEVTLRPLSKADRALITEPLRSGTAGDPRAILSRLAG